MTVRIRLAETTEDLDALFRLRHRVFVEEKGWFPRQPDGRVADRFDAYPTTANIIAVIDGRVVGGIRFAAAGPPGMPTDRYFDFSPFLPPDARAFSGSMLCVEPDQRNIRRLVSAMIGIGYYWGLTQGLTHLVGATNPRVAPIFLATGARAAAPEFVDELTGLAVVPVVIDLSGLDGRFLAFARRQQVAHSFQSFERQLHRAGETIIRQGDEAAAAFVIVEGEVEVAPSDHGLARLGRGEAFGEVALLTSRRHPADVVAATDLELMVLERQAFQVPPEHDSEMAPWPDASSEQASVPASVQPEAGVPPARGREWWRRPRVLVEGSDPVWRRFVGELLGGDYELASCTGPELMRGGCPLVRGGRCVLAERADVILNTFDLERARRRGGPGAVPRPPVGGDHLPPLLRPPPPFDGPRGAVLHPRRLRGPDGPRRRPG